MTPEDITPQEFLDWIKANPIEFANFFYAELGDLIYMLEQDDYFGTEGFNKRFA
jgi:hypothetical protein